jgi:hypothetical protein
MCGAAFVKIIIRHTYQPPVGRIYMEGNLSYSEERCSEEVESFPQSILGDSDSIFYGLVVLWYLKKP